MSQRNSIRAEVNDNEGESEYTWQVKANDRLFHHSFKKKRFLFFKKDKYADNSIRTSKYNVITFLPFNLFEQFHRVANLYFLLIVILQTVPAISTLPWFAVMIPLLFLLFVRGFKDLLHDIARHRSDTAINNRPCDVLMGRSFCRERWRDIQVGDILRLQKDDFVPADMLLLYSSEPNSLCYVETAELDGETNLKFKQALSVTHKGLCTDESVAEFDGKVTCEEPNSNMHTFIGTLEWNAQKYSLDNDHILLRGCRIRNTESCYGLVIYAGFDTKIMKNSGKVAIKKTKLDHKMDNLVVIVFGILIFCTLCLAITAASWAKWFEERHHYIPSLQDVTPAHSAFLIFWGYIILMSSIVPLSMYITLEFIHLVHSLFIDWDVEMYFSQNNTPAKARSTNLNDLLGQVEYVFSDKTGTLTQNIMTFKKCCINTRIYGSNTEDEKNLQKVNFSWNKYADNKFCFYDQSLIDMVRQNGDELLREFFRLLAICHTVMVNRKGDELIYQAASPDEEALVTAARNMGYVFISRTQDTITTNELGVERTYKILALFDFNSVRKRMSVLVKDPDGKIKLYTKGADDVILARLHPYCSDKEITEEALDLFANETLRTLCTAYKEVDVSFYMEWSKRYHEANVSLLNRAGNLEMVYDEMEVKLQLLGATAIEDKLQDRVPETIQLLKDANIKVWVLTGDKQETAINIGFSCRLLSDDMEILDEGQICDTLNSYWENNNSLSSSRLDLLRRNIFRKHGNSLKGRKVGLVVNGDFLNEILGSCNQKDNKHSLLKRLAEKCCTRRISHSESEESLREWAFVDLASQCQTVICCRVTPKQKSMIVQLVKKYRQATTLSIGDGANDVNMIKTADIGVGISGLEGTQAVQSSDYALAQFCFLQRLLLVHGRWSYLRIAKFLRYFFYKTFASVLTHVWFACFNGFTALVVYDPWYITFYSILFTAFPVLSLGLLEQDVSDKVSLQVPELYKVGQSDLLFTYKTFSWSFLKGVITSMATFFVTFGAFVDTAGPDGICDYQAFAVTTATSVILAVTLEITFEISFWTLLSVLAVLLSPVIYFLMSLLTQTYPLFRALPTMFSFPDVSKTTLSYAYIWLIILLAVVISLLPSLVVSFVTKHISRNQVHHVSINHEYKAVAALKVNTVAMGTPFKRGTLHRRSSYAFSHREGYADLITSGRSLRRVSGTVDGTVKTKQSSSVGCE
ncbi:phospholipid-transporting ATPase IK-like [Spea bombifrons]|uniref:phospholipid-transporting ATPase IK-like n=1 Tax=Spea bombifrons TaxID=233779 RepID=UPI00234978A9|nr:phospholipid-transporting ATPase IK-like [Spea bombifrons]